MKTAKKTPERQTRMPTFPRPLTPAARATSATSAASALRRLLRAALFAATLGAAGLAHACPDDPGDAGSPCAAANAPASLPAASPNLGAGNPINVITGNKYQQEVDLPALPGVLGLEIVRHYNSALAGPHTAPGLLGRGWKLSYETALYAGRNTVTIVQADGRRLDFQRDLLKPDQAAGADPANGTLRITRTGDGGGDRYVWSWPDGRRLSFNRRGQLAQIQAATGELLSLQYDPQGLLVTVTDPQGRSLHLHTLMHQRRDGDRYRGVHAIDSPAGRFTYAYGSAAPKGAPGDPAYLAANLVHVGLPVQAGNAGAGRTYHYEDARYSTYLTGVSIDSTNSDGKPVAQRYATFAYNRAGRAVLSTHAHGADRVTLDYGPGGQSTVTNSLGQKTVYRHAIIGGQYRLLEVKGAGCALCGEPNVKYGYDKLGRLTETTQLTATGQPIQTSKTELDHYGRPLKVSRIGYRNGKPQAAQAMVRYEYPAGSAATPTLIARPSVVPGREAQTRIAYNAHGQPVSVTETGLVAGARWQERERHRTQHALRLCGDQRPQRARADRRAAAERQEQQPGGLRHHAHRVGQQRQLHRRDDRSRQLQEHGALRRRRPDCRSRQCGRRQDRLHLRCAKPFDRDIEQRPRATLPVRRAGPPDRNRHGRRQDLPGARALRLR